LNGKSVYDIGIPGYTWKEDRTGKIILQRKEEDSDKDKYEDEFKMSAFIDEVGTLKWCHAAAPAAAAAAAAAPAAEQQPIAGEKTVLDIIKGLLKRITEQGECAYPNLDTLTGQGREYSGNSHSLYLEKWRRSRKTCITAIREKTKHKKYDILDETIHNEETVLDEEISKKLPPSEYEKKLIKNRLLFDPSTYINLFVQGGGRRTRKRRAISKNKTHKGVLHSGRYTPRRKRSALRKTQKKYSSTK